MCALHATKDHINMYIYDPTVPDPAGLINQGHNNKTARAIQLYQGQKLDAAAFVALIQAVVTNNKQGGWRKLQKIPTKQ